jgi:hypothetical protein
MNAGFNRAIRRSAAARARRLSDILARTAFDYDARGQLLPVSDERARAVLRQGYERMLRGLGEPVVLRIADEAASAFPRVGPAPDSGASAWLAVGLDAAGSATYVVRWLRVEADNPDAVQVVAEAMLLRALKRQCRIPGFPVAGRA